MENAHFGLSVSISGTYAVVGAPYETNENGYQAGAVYVFRREGGSWNQVRRILANDGAAYDHFGYSVSFSNPWLVVGAPYTGNGGAAYLFKRTHLGWPQKQKLLPADIGTDDVFGYAVSISGSYAVVGAPFDNNDKGNNAGSVYVFKKGDGTETWAQQKKVLAGDGEADDAFGYSVSIHENSFVAGAPHEDTKGNMAGAFYVFDRDGTNWVQFKKQTANDGSVYDYFGFSVSISGGSIASGAPGDDTAKGLDAGSMYIYRRSGNNLVQETRRVPFNGASGDQFGYSVAIANTRAVGGAPFAREDNGRVYVFQRQVDAPEWQLLEEIKVYNNHSGLGRAVATDFAQVLAGAPYHGAQHVGKAWAQWFGYTTVASMEDNPASSLTPDEMAPATEIPGAFVLHGNFPNPFNPTTTIRFDLPEAADVRIEVVDLMGRLVMSREMIGLSAGAHQSVTFDAGTLSSGLYLYRVTAQTADRLYTQSGRMTLLK